jgi:hypothetical protein
MIVGQLLTMHNTEDRFSKENFPKKTINNTISFLQVMSNTEADSFIMPFIFYRDPG